MRRRRRTLTAPVWRPSAASWSATATNSPWRTPEVDLWCGLDTAPLLAALHEAGGEATASSSGGRTGAPLPVPSPAASVDAYVKICDGCDRRCSYCAIPLIKGDFQVVAAPRCCAGPARPSPPGRANSSWWARTRRGGTGGVGRSRPAARRASGARALSGLAAPPLLAAGRCLQTELLEALGAYAVPYVDMPLQHASGAVLRRMRRAGDGATHLALLERVRAALPGAAVRSTFITGFPGETEAEFEELVDFVATPDSPSPACSSSTHRRARLRPACPAPCLRSSPWNAPPASVGVMDSEAAQYWGALRAVRSTCSSSAASRGPTAWRPAASRCRPGRGRADHRHRHTMPPRGQVSAPSCETASGMIWRP